MGKERENFYQKLKRSPEEWHTHKRMETYLKYFDGHKRLSQSEENKCVKKVPPFNSSLVTPSLSCVHIHSLCSD